jgi:hypothetical protein
MTTVIDIVKELTPKVLARKLGVRNTAISNAVAQSRFPARWYQVVSEMCSDKGMDVEGGGFRALFNFIPNDEHDGQSPLPSEVVE